MNIDEVLKYLEDRIEGLFLAREIAYTASIDLHETDPVRGNDWYQIYNQNSHIAIELMILKLRIERTTSNVS